MRTGHIAEKRALLRGAPSYMFFLGSPNCSEKSSISVSRGSAFHSATCTWFEESVRNSRRKAAIGFAGDVARRAAGEKEVVFFHCDVVGSFFAAPQLTMSVVDNTLLVKFGKEHCSEQIHDGTDERHGGNRVENSSEKERMKALMSLGDSWKLADNGRVGSSGPTDRIYQTG